MSQYLVDHSGTAMEVDVVDGGVSVNEGKSKVPEGGRKCKCGSSDHSRISNKNCPLYKPRLKLQNRDPGQFEKTVTATTGLNSVLKLPALKDVILDAVSRCADIQVETSRLLNGYVIWMIERNQPLPDLRFSSGIMRQFYMAVCSVHPTRLPHQHKTVSTESVNEYIDTVYAQCRPDQLAWNDSTKLGQLVSNMARMHSVNCQNHVVTNIVKWIRKWFCWKLGKHLRHFLSADHFNDVVSFTMREVTRSDDDDN